MSSYWLRHRGRVRGPLDLDTLRRMDAEGRLPAEVQVSESEDGLYYPIDSLRYLLDTRAAPSVPIAGTAPARAPGSAVPSAAASRPAVPKPAQRGEPDEPKSARIGISFAAPALLAFLSLATVGAAFALDDLGRHEAAREVPNEGRLLRVAIVYGFRAMRVEVQTGREGRNEADAELARATLGAGTVTYAALAKASADTDSDRQVPAEQSQMLGIAILVLLSVGALVGTATSLAAAGSKRVPGGSTGGCLVPGLLGMACTVAFRAMGLLGGRLPDGTLAIITGPSFFLALTSGICSTLAGISLFRASQRLARTARRRR